MGCVTGQGTYSIASGPVPSAMKLQLDSVGGREPHIRRQADVRARACPAQHYPTTLPAMYRSLFVPVPLPAQKGNLIYARGLMWRQSKARWSQAKEPRAFTVGRFRLIACSAVRMEEQNGMNSKVRYGPRIAGVNPSKSFAKYSLLHVITYRLLIPYLASVRS